MLIGEDVGAAGGVFKLTEGLFERFGADRVRDTPISEQAIVGAAMGAAMTGLRPVAELMFSDFFAVTWDMVANQIAKSRYMTDGQIAMPLVIRTANGGGLRFGAQHSQSIENWAMAIPGLKVVAPSTPADVEGLMAAAIRDPDPVSSASTRPCSRPRARCPTGSTSCRSGRRASSARATTARSWRWRRWSRGPPRPRNGSTPTMGSPPRSSTCAPRPPGRADRSSLGGEDEPPVHRRGEPAPVGWGAEIVSIVADEGFWRLDAPLVRITTPHIPLPSAAALEDLAIPSVDRIVETPSAQARGGAPT